MAKENFKALDSHSSKEQPEIYTKEPLTIFFKRKLNHDVLYTMINSKGFKVFEEQDYQKKHQDRDFEIMYVLNGSLTNTIEQNVTSFKAGEGYILNPQINHKETLDNNCTVVFINLSSSLLKKLMKNLKNNGPVFSFFKHNLSSDNSWERNFLEFTTRMPYLNKIFEITLDSLQQELVTPKVGSKYFQAGLVLRLLAELEDETYFHVTNISLDQSKDDFLVDQIIRLIENHYGDITRKDLEKNLHYNSEYLNRLLKSKTRLTISEYAQNIRIKNAEQLLINTDWTVQKISQKLGFSSETYFYHYFKRHLQLSPRVYRNKFKV